jgi:hypothetical protein
VNVISGDGASVSTIVQAHRQYPDMVGMPTLPNTIFDRAHHGLFPGWREATDSFVAIMAPLLANGTAVGVFLGDEICCSGVPLSNLTSVANRLRAGLPAALLYTNECSVMGAWPDVPAALDFISIDFYDEHNHRRRARGRPQPQVLLGSDLLQAPCAPAGALRPGIFASDPLHCAKGNVSCPLDAQAVQVRAGCRLLSRSPPSSPPSSPLPHHLCALRGVAADVAACRGCLPTVAVLKWLLDVAADGVAPG